MILRRRETTLAEYSAKLQCSTSPHYGEVWNRPCCVRRSPLLFIVSVMSPLPGTIPLSILLSLRPTSCRHLSSASFQDMLGGIGQAKTAVLTRKDTEGVKDTRKMNKSSRDGNEVPKGIGNASSVVWVQ